MNIGSSLGFSDHSRRSATELMLLVQRGDTLAFEQLYRTMMPIIRNFVSSRNCDEASADDVVQEVFCRVWQQRGNFKSAGASAKTYLLRVALNVLYELGRDKHRRGGSVDETAEHATVACQPIEHAVANDLAIDLNRARRRLSSEQSGAIVMICDRQASPQEAAIALGCTEKALRNRLDRARRKIHRFLESKGWLAPKPGRSPADLANREP